ncbi:MAG: glycosyltransferase family 4 protein [Verrucomicrobia bacterium]|nr:glycosyltransferase family 4 protein [Verrucomicrobiota bacterium]
MRIAILSNYATWALEGRPGYRPDVRRHPAPWVANLAHALARLGTIEVHVVTQTDEIEHDMEAESQGVRLHFLRCPRRLRATTLFVFDCRRLHRALRRIQPDLVHSHGTEDAYTIAALKSGYPTVMTMQGLQFKITKHVKSPWFSRMRLMQTLEQWCLRHVRHIIAKSEHVAESVAPLAPQAEIYRIPNAMNPVFFENTARAAAGEPQRLLFGGIIAPVKGLQHLVTALDRLRPRWPGVKLAIVGVPGRGSEGYFESIREQILALRLEDAVEFHGFQRPENMAREMAQASVVIVPSLHEMFCNMVAEAMAVGRPVVASWVGSLPELVDDGRTGLLVPSADPESLAAAIERLLADEPLRTRMGLAATEKARRLWDPQQVARQTEEVYRVVLGTGSDGAGR